MDKKWALPLGLALVAGQHRETQRIHRMDAELHTGRRAVRRIRGLLVRLHVLGPASHAGPQALVRQLVLEGPVEAGQMAAQGLLELLEEAQGLDGAEALGLLQAAQGPADALGTEG